MNILLLAQSAAQDTVDAAYRKMQTRKDELNADDTAMGSDTTYQRAKRNYDVALRHPKGLRNPTVARPTLLHKPCYSRASMLAACAQEWFSQCCGSKHHQQDSKS